MNALIDWLLISNVYLIIVGLLFIGLRAFLYKYNGSKSLLYKMWIILPVGLLVLTVLLHIETNIDLLPQFNIYQLPTIMVTNQAEVMSFWKPVLIICWLIISAFGLISLSIKYQQLNKLLKAKTEGVNSGETSCIVSPLAFGLFPAKIYLPTFFEKQFSPEQQQLLLQHEQVHCNRHDPLMRIIYKIMELIFWFNPIIYVLSYLMKKDQEISCDEIVLTKNNKLVAYSKLLLLLNQNSNYQQNKLPELYCSSLSTLKERIMLIKDLKSKNISVKSTIMNQGALVLAIASLVVTTAVLASTSVPQPPNSPALIAVVSPEIPEAPVAPVLVSAPNKDNQVAFLVNTPMPDPSTPVILEVPATAKSENKIIPIVRIAPNYPRSAAIEKITGYVTVEFDVMPSGHVGDAMVVDSEPVGIFEKEAVKSIKKYKFAPIAETVRVRQKVEFNLD